MWATKRSAVPRSASLRPALTLLVAGLAATAGAACYQPTAVDCQLTCEGPDDCLPGQVCDDDRRCTAPETANTCDLADAAPGDPDATTIDATTIDATTIDAEPADATTIDATPIDAEPADAGGPTSLVITITGRGRVFEGDTRVCNPANSPCTVDGYLAGTELTFTAVANAMHHFVSWSGACSGSTTVTCTLTATAPTTAFGVTFAPD